MNSRFNGSVQIMSDWLESGGDVDCIIVCFVLSLGRPDGYSDAGKSRGEKWCA